MATTSIYRITATLTGVAGSPYYMRAYFDAAAGASNLAGAAWFDFLNPGAPALPSGSILAIDPVADIVDPVTGDIVGTASAGVSSVTGTSTADFISPTSQGLVRWRTGVYVGGREVRGRTNLPCMAESNNEGRGTPTAGFVTGVGTRAATLIAAANVSHVVYSKKNGLWQETTSGSAWNQWAVLRSRRD